MDKSAIVAAIPSRLNLSLGIPMIPREEWQERLDDINFRSLDQ